MPQTYYTKIKVQGTSTAQPVSVEAGSTVEAKRIIEAQHGKVSYLNGPTGRGRNQQAPSWFR